MYSFCVFLFEDGIILRVKIIRKVWKLILPVFLIFFGTLLVFPGLVADVQDCRIGDWPTIILITLFSVSDTISRVSMPLSLTRLLSFNRCLLSYQSV